MNSMNVNVVLDTNGAIYAMKHRVDIERQLIDMMGSFKLYVPSCVVDELSSLMKSNCHARAAYTYFSRFEICKTSTSGDMGVFDCAVRLNAAVITNDRIFQGILRDNGIKIIYFRGYSRLEMD